MESNSTLADKISSINETIVESDLSSEDLAMLEPCDVEKPLEEPESQDIIEDSKDVEVDTIENVEDSAEDDGITFIDEEEDVPEPTKNVDDHEVWIPSTGSGVFSRFKALRHLYDDEHTTSYEKMCNLSREECDKMATNVIKAYCEVHYLDKKHCLGPQMWTEIIYTGCLEPEISEEQLNGYQYRLPVSTAMLKDIAQLREFYSKQIRRQEPKYNRFKSIGESATEFLIYKVFKDFGQDVKLTIKPANDALNREAREWGKKFDTLAMEDLYAKTITEYKKLTGILKVPGNVSSEDKAMFIKDFETIEKAFCTMGPEMIKYFSDLGFNTEARLLDYLFPSDLVTYVDKIRRPNRKGVVNVFGQSVRVKKNEDGTTSYRLRDMKVKNKTLLGSIKDLFRG